MAGHMRLVTGQPQAQMLLARGGLGCALLLQAPVLCVLMCPHEIAALCASASVKLNLLMQHKFVLAMLHIHPQRGDGHNSCCGGHSMRKQLSRPSRRRY